MQLIDTIETPEGIRLERRLAGIGSRLLAGFIDGLLIVLLMIFLGIGWVLVRGNPAAWLAGGEGPLAWVLAMAIGAAFAVYWGYYVLCEWFMNGQSPGKRAFGLRVVKEGGGPITFVDIAIRNLLRIVDGLAIYAIAGITMFCTRKVQRLGDLAAGTVVIWDAAPNFAANANRPRVVDGQAAGWPTGLRASGLTPDEFRILRNYCLRRGELTLEARARVLPRLLAPVLYRSGRALPNHSYLVMEQYVDELMRQAYAMNAPSSGPKMPR
jgi:uncharacterized RDD family membrane protein YckC